MGHLFVVGGSIAHIGAETLAGSDKHLTGGIGDGERFDVVRQQLAVGCREVMNLLHIVGADQIDTVVAGTKPFSVCLIHCHAGNIHTAQQIVGIIGTVVSRHFHLGKRWLRVIQDMRSDVERSLVGSYPQIVLQVFLDASDIIEIDFRTILIGEGLAEHLHLIGFRLIADDGWSFMVVIHEPEPALPVLHQTRHRRKTVAVRIQCLLVVGYQLVVFHLDDGAVGSLAVENPQLSAFIR